MDNARYPTTLWETVQFLERAADHLLDGCAEWTPALDEAAGILTDRANTARRAAAGRIARR